MAGSIVRDFDRGKLAFSRPFEMPVHCHRGARNVGMSYRRAWVLIESLKQWFREPVTVAGAGGKNGGGMLVTEFGDALIRSHRELERDFARLAERRLHPVVATVIRHSKSGAKVSVRGKLD
jgi:molybdate transport repressor ModE-like protein